MKKFQRLIGLIYLLKKGPILGRHIAEKMGTSERTVLRDIQELNEALGDYVRVYNDGNGYSLDDSLYAPPLHFIAEELEALYTAIQAMESNNPHYQLAHQALSKIESQSGARPGLLQMEEHLKVMQPAAKDRTPVKRLQELEQQLRKKRVLLLDYFSHNSGQIKEIRFAPYALIYRKNAWYLIGYHAEKAKILLLRAYRIQNIRLTDEAFELPQDFTVKAFFQTHWEVFDGNPEPIQLRFTGQSALRIPEMIWHSSQRFFPQPDQSLLVELQVPVNPEFISWVLSHGAECEVLAPLRLKEKVQAHIQAMYAIYLN